jgi:DHA2 family multidrug resistance protein-like MFS transporter
MVNVALPSIAESLNATPAISLRIVLAYQTALVAALLPAAALAESVGYRRMFSAGLVLFITASLLCAAPPSLEWLIAVRFLQGLGGAAIMALGVALLRQALPSSRIGAAIGWNALTVAIASAAGPMLGALTVSYAGWQWLFLAHLPLGLFALGASRALPAIAGTRSPLDLVSIVLSGVGFASLIGGAHSLGHSPAPAFLLLIAAAGSFLMLLRRELPKSSPLIPLDLLARRPFRLSVLASICCFVAQSAGLLALPFYLERTLGETPMMSGLYLALWPAAVAVAALISGRLSDGPFPYWFCLAGGVLLAFGLGGTSMLPDDAGPLPVAGLTIACGTGFGFFQVPNNRSMFLWAPVDRAAAAGGMQGTARLTGQAGGAILMTLLFVWMAMAGALRLGLAIAACFALAAGLISILQRPVPDRR